MGEKSLWTQQQEEKLQAWHRMQLKAEQGSIAPCVTIAREFGCQAYPLAEELISRLNAKTKGAPWVIVGDQILDRVAELSGYNVDQIEKSQNTPSSLKAIFSMFLDKSRAEETEVFDHMLSAIRSFAQRGNCVIVGRGGAFAVQGLSHCLNLRLVAPSEFRIDKIMKSQGLSELEAIDYIALHQQQRDDFIRRFTNGSIADPLLYHMVINNAHMETAKIAEVVEEYMDRYIV